MQDSPNSFDTPLVGLPKGEWLERLAAIADENGHFQPLGKRHFATFVEEKPTLLVTFETVQGIHALSDTAQPMGWDLVKALGWSHLGIISDGDTWFRERRVFGYFDRLIDDGFFEDFDQVIFYGAGPCGYAAAAYSVASPGATVIAVHPQATLDPSVAGWDQRFRTNRRTSFTDRYGYAPDMIDAADHAYVLYDPEIDLDAMHAALFTRPNVTKLEMRHMGDALQTDLIEMQILFRLIAKAGSGKLDKNSFARLFRARRDYPPYLRNVMNALDSRKRFGLTKMLCQNVIRRLENAPRFSRRLEALEKPTL
ncbi:MAG: phosphoadenosine phosphosulfate reductase [Rhodobacterales bacterium]|nr:phosphoadenosine phosphosulfate reductase [Rhodobacterales bacterium]